MTVGSLFSGIGGFDLGFERAGFEIKWQVEIDDYANRVLARHWPDVRRYGDVRGVTGVELGTTDVICGGFPCQPHSLAGKREGSEDDRDLWPSFRRIIGEVRPRWVVAENVPGLLSSDAGRFFGDVLRDLAAFGYDSEWECLPAYAFGAPHIRERVWVVAHAGCLSRDIFTSLYAHCDGEQGAEGEERDSQNEDGDVAVMGRTVVIGGAWVHQPSIRRVVNGVSDGLDAGERLRGLGNAIVPQIAEWIARRILDAEQVNTDV